MKSLKLKNVIGLKMEQMVMEELYGHIKIKKEKM